jgi:polyphosphate kinase
MSTSEAADYMAFASKSGPALRGAGPSEVLSESVTEKLLGRELSWLEFNARVLELAADATLPLLERVRFCAIFASNLDQFFMVRVAGLERRASSDTADGRTARTTLAAVRARVLELETHKESVWAQEIRPALTEEGIVVVALEELDDTELGELDRRLEAEIFPLLTPWAVGQGDQLPRVAGTSLNLAVLVRDANAGEPRFASVTIPEGTQRFMSVGTRGFHVPIERSVLRVLPRLFPGTEVVDQALFRVTRATDFEISHDADDILEAVAVELRRRRLGTVVRLELASPVSTILLDHLAGGLAVEDEQIHMARGLLGLADLSQLADLDRPELKNAPWISRTPARLTKSVGPGDMFAEIRKRDLLVHHPYDSFASTFDRFVTEAAKDPKVAAMKTTVYRTSEESPLVPALVEVAESGRDAVCLVELKARFDEQRNIEWSRALERAGVQVAYGFSDLKTHAKTTLVVRHEGAATRRYVHIGTGNYHALTARSYEDFGLFTADEEIADDVSDFFNVITGFGRPERFRKILVAPFNLRRRLVEEIRAVARSARAGERARIRLKTNALTDEAMVEELYAASRAGASIDIVARSMCALRPGVRGLSENVRVRSVLGRFLEHSRVFLFEAGARSSAFIGSADLMQRNLDDRIEILVPVEDERARADLDEVFEVLLGDDSAWVLGPDGGWTRAQRHEVRPERRTHERLMQRAADRAAARSASRVGASRRGAARLREPSGEREGA